MSRTSDMQIMQPQTPADQTQRDKALDVSRSILVQAPAGSGKTDLLTRRFLRLLAEVSDPSQVVAITFTKAAAAEMRDRILMELEKAVTAGDIEDESETSMRSLAIRALRHSESLGWKLLESPAQLRISTIDSFCREIAVQQPILSGFAGDLSLSEHPAELYRTAARRTLEQIDNPHNPVLSHAVTALLTWRDNNWTDVEDQLVSMLEVRDRWMQDFVLNGERDWEGLRAALEAPFAAAVKQGLERLSAILSQNPDACREAHILAKFACEHSGKHRELAELAVFPCGPFESAEEQEEARLAFLCLADMLLKDDGEFRRQINKTHGFSTDHRDKKTRMERLLQELQEVPGLQQALLDIRCLPPARYSEEEWRIVRACFTLLRHAAAELRVAFEEANMVDFVEVAQRAQLILESEDGLPTDAAIAMADKIQHLLVDEFQDTSRRQHKLVTSLVKAWPDSSGRTVFVVGDPMQSIYAFRDADAELFERVKTGGLNLAEEERLQFESVALTANFRTAHSLVRQNNEIFAQVFATEDGSGINFFPSQPARADEKRSAATFALHLDFMEEPARANSGDGDALRAKEESAAARSRSLSRQVERIVELIRAHQSHIEKARAAGAKYRIAVLGRTKAALAPIASALREDMIPFRAVDLEALADRTEVRDVLALAAALLNDEDRVAWLAVLRAPWCGLRLEELHCLVSADDPDLMQRTVSALIGERLALLDDDSRRAVERVRRAIQSARLRRAEQPTSALGTWLRAAWEEVGGAACVDGAAAENLELLWACFDALPNAEVGLLADGIHALLAKLMAQPDPAAESHAGVQLMTIHKSKGLEFEVVIVPELQASCGRPQKQMLSWLERGVAESEGSQSATEFLIAPQQSRGTERGDTKAWVDGKRRERERQEMRRLLYVASTRAREELHLFARPEFKEKDGELSLCVKTDSLLATGWRAFAPRVEAAFHDWVAAQSDDVVELAAQAALLQLRSGTPAASKSALLRLPNNFEPPAHSAAGRERSIADSATFTRHTGGVESRALGVGVHLLLEHAARWASTMGWPAVERQMETLAPRIHAQARSAGLSPQQAERLEAEAMKIAREVLRDSAGVWILSPHPQAESEIAWTEWGDSGLRTLRVDRVFRAGEAPSEAGDDFWWIVDYKTAQFELRDRDFAMTQLRSIFKGQLETYAHVLRELHGKAARVRAGIYYPRLQLFDWWEL